MSKILILDKPRRDPADESPTSTTSRLIEESRNAGLIPTFKTYQSVSINNISNNINILVDDENLDCFNFVILRGHRTAAEYQLKRIIAQNIDHSICTLQNKDFLISTPVYNKLEQLVRLTKSDIPYVPTYYHSSGKKGEAPEDLPFIAKNYRYSFHISGGRVKKDLHKIDTLEEIQQLDLTYPNKYLFQKYLTPSHDFRALFIGGELKYIIRRTATDKFITISNGIYENIPLNQIDIEIKRLAIKTNSIYKGNFSAVDIMSDQNENYYVLEINMNPGIKALENKTKFSGEPPNIAREIIQSLVNISRE